MDYTEPLLKEDALEGDFLLNLKKPSTSVRRESVTTDIMARLVTHYTHPTEGTDEI